MNKVQYIEDKERGERKEMGSIEKVHFAILKSLTGSSSFPLK
jgi:hypothetical protein